MTTSVSLYERVTQQIIDELEKGVAPWVKPWTSAGGNTLMPYNATSHHRYQGVNVLLLWHAAQEKGYQSPGWITYRQAQGLGGYVRRGEKATVIVFTSTFIPKAKQAEEGEAAKPIPFLKWLDVFNVEQTEGLPEDVSPKPRPVPMAEAMDGVEAFLRQVGATVRHGGNRASYAPALDAIQLPLPGNFESAAHYYATSLHEHVHWTGHETRLHRDLSGRFGEAAYAAEELVAELGAAFLCAVLAIPGRLRHAEYIGSWLQLLQHDHRAIFTAAARATDAAHYLEGKGGLHLATDGAEATP